MKKILSLAAFLFTSLAHAQKYYDVKVITKTNDTINGTIELFRGIMDGAIGIKEATYYGGPATLVDEKHRWVKTLKPKDMSELHLAYPSGHKEHWVSNGKTMMKIVWEGRKVKWVMSYSHMLDGTPVQDDYWIDRKGNAYLVNRLNFRRSLLAITADKPQFAQEIKEVDFAYARFLQILQDYDAL